MPLSKDLREFVESLNANEVEYVIVGAFALAFHGVPRYTGDLDLLVRPSPENSARVLRALSQFGFGQLSIKPADLEEPENIIQLGLVPNRIDILTSIDGVTFDEAWSTRAESHIDGVRVMYLGREALLRNKEATGRTRDIADAEELRKRDP